MSALSHTVRAFGAAHPLQITITAGLVLYSVSKKKLTPDGIAAAVGTAVVHMLHPWGVFFYLLVTFFLAGTIATKVHHRQKALLTQSSAGGTSDENSHGRNASQVLANSLPATLFILLHLYFSSSASTTSTSLLPIGIIASYAAATADTLSSELGILSPSTPFLITPPFTRVPRGTNGGVTVHGLAWGLVGGALIATTSLILLPSPATSNGPLFFLGVSVAGLFGSVLDSVLGALAQVSVEDKSSGRIVEGPNGRRVLVVKGDGKAGGSRVVRGRDLLNNNGVNFAMAMGTGLGAMAVARVIG